MIRPAKKVAAALSDAAAGQQTTIEERIIKLWLMKQAKSRTKKAEPAQRKMRMVQKSVDAGIIVSFTLAGTTARATTSIATGRGLRAGAAVR